MYCLWATPTHQQLSLYDRREVSDTLFSCSATLVEYAHKWSTAHVFRDIFELLTQIMPISEYGDPMQQWTCCPERAAELLQLSAKLESLQIQERIISLVRSIAEGPRPSYMPPSIEETEWIQYAA